MGVASLVLGIVSIVFVVFTGGVASPVAAVLGIVGALMLGLGMCMVMLWNLLVAGIAVGLAGILLMLCLIPLLRGLED